MKYAIVFLLLGLPWLVQAQRPELQFFRPISKDGINVFEDPKVDTVEFDGVSVRVGGDFALQFQGINQSNAQDSLAELGTNFNLPTANLNLDVQLYDGVRMHLRTYLSSRHHNEAWIKGGHIQIDKLDFIQEGFLQSLMDKVRIRIGLDEINYGDMHFRRSDNARAIFNPFVGNYIMDAFTTEAFGEVMYLSPTGVIAMLGISNGKLNQNVIVNPNTDNSASFYGKLGIDRQFSDDFRFRLTGSFYTSQGTSTGTYLYGGDRAGGRYYGVLSHIRTGSNDFEPRFNPRFRQITAFQINPFIKAGGLEFFGAFEVAGNSEDEGNGGFTQIAGDLIYRFGDTEQFYLATRYNSVSGEMTETAATRTISRFNIGGGWFLTKNIMTKLEYVTQQYNEDGWNNSKYDGAEFSGIVLEAAISF
jgi:hypothetical protein